MDALASAPPPSPPLPPDTGRAVPGAGDPYPPMQAGSLDCDCRPRTTPRSARAALEPERMPPPKKRSKRARNPIVIVGNLLLTLLFLVTIGAGVVFMIGKQRFERPDRSRPTRSSTFRRAASATLPNCSSARA